MNGQHKSTPYSVFGVGQTPASLLQAAGTDLTLATTTYFPQNDFTSAAYYAAQSATESYSAIVALALNNPSIDTTVVQQNMNAANNIVNSWSNIAAADQSNNATDAISYAINAIALAGAASALPGGGGTSPAPSSGQTVASAAAAVSSAAAADSNYCTSIATAGTTFYNAVANFKNVWNAAYPNNLLVHNGQYDSNCASAVSSALGTNGPAACSSAVTPIVVNPPPGVKPPVCGAGLMLDPTQTKCIQIPVVNPPPVVVAPATTTNWLPWVLGGVGVVAGVGLILYANSKKNAGAEAPALPMTPVMAHELMLTENPRRRTRKNRRSRK